VLVRRALLVAVVVEDTAHEDTPVAMLPTLALYPRPEELLCCPELLTDGFELNAPT
jgi:hypothetical protein